MFYLERICVVIFGKGENFSFVFVEIGVYWFMYLIGFVLKNQVCIVDIKVIEKIDILEKIFFQIVVF